MKKCILFILLLQICAIGRAQSTSKTIEKINNNYYIVEGNETYKVDQKLLLAKLKSGLKLRQGIRGTEPSLSGIIRISVPDSVELDSYASFLEQTGDFEFVDFNGYYTPYLSPNDTYINDQWYLNTINIYNTWDITTGSSSVKVAVIDNGISSTHPDLASNLSPYEGYDYVNNTCPSTTGGSHGTMIAGLIGAKTNNNIGIAGVAGGNNSDGVKIIPYRTNYDNDQVISALEDAIIKGVKVVNMSFGGCYNYALSQVITTAYNSGITIVCASGNSNNSYLPFPASHNYTIAVGASTNLNLRWEEDNSNGSNYGAGLDLVAPGKNIKSTNYNNGNNDYYTDSGTSYAAPQVAGVAALMLSVNPTLTPSQIRSKLRSSCTKLTDYQYTNGWNSEVGYGLLNAHAAVRSALSGDQIIGPNLIYNYGDYIIENLPSGISGLTVSWSLIDNYYNTGYNLLLNNCPYVNQCRIFRDHNHDLMEDTLTAEIKYNNMTIKTLKKGPVYAYAGFKGNYTSGNLSGNIPNSYYFNIRTNATTYIKSPNFYGATVTYSSSGATPTIWGFSPSDGDLTFVTTTPNAAVVINVTDGCGNSYVLYAYATGQYGINVSNEGNSIIVTLNDDDDSQRDSSIDQSWTIEVRSVTTGQLMATQSSTNRSESISTVGWPKGIYIVKATIDKEVLTEKVIVR